MISKKVVVEVCTDPGLIQDPIWAGLGRQMRYDFSNGPDQVKGDFSNGPGPGLKNVARADLYPWGKYPFGMLIFQDGYLSKELISTFKTNG